jgi:hypothetical protein
MKTFFNIIALSFVVVFATFSGVMLEKVAQYNNEPTVMECLTGNFGSSSYEETLVAARSLFVEGMNDSQKLEAKESLLDIRDEIDRALVELNDETLMDKAEAKFESAKKFFTSLI